MSSDPLLRAVAHGDEHCPDGRNLARMGALVRAAAPRAHADLRDRVRDALGEASRVDGDGADDTAIERWLAGAPDAALDRLGALARAASGQPRQADLRDRVRRAIAPASLRLTPSQAAAAGRRWRLVAAIAAVHVAAILLFTSLDGRQAEASAPGAHAGRHRSDSGGQAAMPSWDELRRAGGDVLAPRRTSATREEARADAHLAASAGTVAGLVTYLIAGQDPVSGRFAITVHDRDRALATQALAALALLGEGGGDRTRLDRARLALLPVAAAIADPEPIAPSALGAAALALVEGALVSREPSLSAPARDGLSRLIRELPGRPHEGGLAGLGWLAIEVAAAGGMEVPPNVIAAARDRIVRPLPGADADCGRTGLAAYARQVSGAGGSDEAAALIGRLAATPPQTDASGRADPLAWFLAGLALHAEGGPAWRAWAAGLNATLLPLVRDAGPGQLRIAAEAVRHADGDPVLATALGVLAMQVPYRYAIPAVPPR